MTNHKIAYELLTPEVIEEMKPLLEAHRDEILPYDDMDVNPNWAFYMDMSASENWALFTVRHAETNELIGYASTFITPSLIDHRFTQAQQDGLFIYEEHRRGMLCARLIAFADTWLTHMGVTYASQRVHKGVDFSPILERQGYEYVEKQYIRRLN